MKFMKFKRCLSVILSLCMLLSVNMTTFAAEPDTPATGDDNQHEQTEDSKHVWERKDDKLIVKPNCGTGKEGAAWYVCYGCGKEEVRGVPAEHTFVAVEQQDPTCMEKGYKAGVWCSVCHEVQEGREEIAIDTVNGHAYGEDPISGNPATCIAPGTAVYACTLCPEDTPNHTKEDGTDPDTVNGHSYDNVPVEGQTVEATCTTPKMETYTCTICTAEVTNHTKAFEVGEPDTENGHEYDMDSPVENSDKPATCVSPATKTYACKNCEEDTPNHTADLPTEGDTTLNTEESGHSYGTEPVSSTTATCVKKATKTYECSECEETTPNHQKVVEEGEVNTEEAGHTYDEGVHDDGNCADNQVGKTVYTCTVCSEGTANHTKEVPDTALTHKPEFYDEQPPTCGAPGKTAGWECSVCKQPVEGKEPARTEIPADTSAHVWGDTATVVVRKADCRSGKNGIGVFECSVCHNTGYQSIVAEHKWSETGTEVSGSDAPTCVAAGKLQFTCQNTYTDADGNCTASEVRDMPAKGHNYSTTRDETKSKDATCKEAGVDFFECQDCTEGTKDHWKQVAVDADPTKHTSETVAQDSAKPADCTHGSRWGEICSVCGDILNRDTGEEGTDWGETGEPTGHSYETKNSEGAFEKDPTKGVVTKETTCDHMTNGQPGEKTYTCDTCSHVETEEIPKVACHSAGYDEESGIDAGVLIDATCTASGRMEFKCVYCKREIQPSVDLGDTDPATGHTWGEPAVAIEASCVDKKNGLGRYTCTVCKVSEYRTIEYREAHQFGDYVVTKQPTCIAVGNKVATCTLCKDEVVQDIEKLGHAYDEDTVVTDHDQYQAATCTAPGVNVYACTRCSATTEGHFKTAPTDQLDHQFSAHGTQSDPEPADCMHGERWGSFCDNCGLANPKQLSVDDGVTEEDANKGVNYNDDETPDAHDDMMEYFDPTCTEPGKIVHQCSMCQKYMKTNGSNELAANKAEATEELADIAPALGHDFSKLIVTLKDKTCTTNGVGTFECLNGCKESRSGIIPASHSYDEGTETIAPTCTTTGVLTKVCSVDASHTTTEVIPALGHEYAVDEAECTAPTCTDGEKVYKCQRTGCVDIYTEPIPAVAEHTWNQEGTIAEANCTDPKKVGEQCSVCQAVRNVHEEGVALGHQWGNWTLKTAATCTKEGEETRTCGRTGCGEVESREVAMTDHTLVSTHVDPTCDENGKHIVSCSVCKDVIEEKDLGEFGETAINHANKKAEAMVAANCHSAALVAATHCPDCEKWSTDNGATWLEERPTTGEMNPENHVWDEGKIITEPTCQNEGSATFTCIYHETVKETQTLPIADHAWGEAEQWTIDGTPEGDVAAVISHCQTEGCGQVKTLYILDGYAFCTQDQAIVTVTKTPAVPATCLQGGRTEGLTCNKCNYVIQEPENTPIGDHTLGEYVIIKAASCTESGTRQAKCSVCEQQYGDIETVEKLGHDYEVQLVEPTCEADGRYGSYCKNCKQSNPSVPEEILVGSKLPHSYVDGVCENCDTPCTHQKYIDKVIPATCTTNKFSGKVCEVCGIEDEDAPVVEVPNSKLPHNFVNGICTMCSTKEVVVNTTMEPVTTATSQKIQITASSKVANSTMKKLEVGFVYITAASYNGTTPANDLKLERVGNGVTKKAGLTDPDKLLTINNYKTSINVTTAHDRVVYARAFVTVEKEDGTQSTYYGPVVSASYTSLTATTPTE